jgi:hypothetical protein
MRGHTKKDFFVKKPNQDSEVQHEQYYLLNSVANVIQKTGKNS